MISLGVPPVHRTILSFLFHALSQDTPRYPAGPRLECRMQDQMSWPSSVANREVQTTSFPRRRERALTRKQMNWLSLIAAGTLFQTSKSHLQRKSKLKFLERPRSRRQRIIEVAAIESERVFTYLCPYSSYTPQPPTLAAIRCRSEPSNKRREGGGPGRGEPAELPELQLHFAR